MSPGSPRDATSPLSDPAVARKLALFASCAEQAIFVGGADGRVEWANDAACRLSGWTGAEIVGREIVLFPDDAEAEREAREHIRRRFEAGERARMEAAVRDREGRPLWVALEVVPIPGGAGAAPGWVAIASDVTERKREEAALAESERGYRSLVELSSGAVAVHSEGRVVYANRAALALLGAASAEAVLGRPVFDFVHPRDHSLVAERILKMELVGDPAAPVKERLLRLDGTPVEVLLAATPITWRGQPAIQLVAHALAAEPEPRDAKPRPARVDLSALLVDLAPSIEERIAPWAVVSFDLRGAPLAVAADRGRLAGLVQTLVARAAAAFPEGRASIRLRTEARQLGAQQLGALLSAEGARAGRFVILELQASACEAAAASPARRSRRPGALRPAHRALRLADAIASVRACGGVLGVEGEAGSRLRIQLGFPASG